MQEPHIKLKEVIWEVTDVCYNNCDYCGSSDTLNRIAPTHDRICFVAEEIAAYPPEELNISGGDPLTLHMNTHEYITKLLKPTTKMKILVSPISLNSLNYKILSLYDWVGISVNTEGELACLTYIWEFIDTLGVTIISNFNTTNIWDYNKIEEFVRKNNLSWQIQYTMYHEDSKFAIYNNDDAKELLTKRVNDSINKGTKIILADNMNTGSCSAGMYSCGILANGEVIPCLSMRAWDKFFPVVGMFGNLFDTSFKNIWEHNFASFRCNKFTCCKDICNSPIEIKRPVVPSVVTISNPGVENWMQPVKTWDYPNIVMAYGVQAQPNTYLYGVFRDNSSSLDWKYDGPTWDQIKAQEKIVNNGTSAKGWTDKGL